MKKEILNLLLENIFNTDIDLLKTVYNTLQNGADVDSPINVKKLKGIYQQFGIDSLCDGFQIDLPYWNSYEPNRKTIMIVAMDAKNNKQSVLDNFSIKKVVLSTPFYLHNSSGRETKKNQYWEVISHLTAEYNVYSTDLYKLYFRMKDSANNSSTESNKVVNYTNSNVHHEILKAEIAIINPSIIIAFGNAARSACANALGIKLENSVTKENIIKGYDLVEKVDTKFLAIPHPSGLTRPNHWLSFFKTNSITEVISHHERPAVLANLIKKAI